MTDRHYLLKTEPKGKFDFLFALRVKLSMPVR